MMARTGPYTLNRAWENWCPAAPAERCRRWISGLLSPASS